MGINDHFLGLWVEQRPVSNRVTDDAVFVGGVFQHKRTQIGRLLGQFTLSNVGIFAMEVCGFDFGPR